MASKLQYLWNHRNAEKYRQQYVMLEVSLHIYYRFTGCSHFISADECKRALNQTLSEPLLRDIDQLVHWITNECFRKAKYSLILVN